MSAAIMKIVTLVFFCGMFVGLITEVRAADSSDPQQRAERSLPGARQPTGESV